MYTATVTRQNQITIPASVRHHQGIKPGNQVVFTRKKNGGFTFARLHDAQDTFGLLKSIDQGQTYDPHAVWHQRYEPR